METSPRVSRLRHIRGACGATVAAVAALALLGWLTGWRVLAEVRTGYIPMAPNTAIGMIACGLGLATFPGGWGGRSRRRRGVALTLTAAAAAIALLRLTEYATGKNLGIDRWVQRAPGELLNLAPVGRMALMTAVGFVLAFVTLALADLGEKRQAAADLASLMALAVASLGGIFVLGYLYNVPFFYGSPTTIPMALNTAFSFVVLGVGLAAAAGSRSLLLRPLCGPSVRARLMRQFLPFVAGAVASTSWATHWVATVAGGRISALVTAVGTVVALLVGAVLCARISGRVGEQIECAEEALKRANDELEVRVAERSRELTLAKTQLEARNDELLRSTADLERTAESARMAHQDLQAAHQDLQAAYHERQLAEGQLVQAEKLSALGQMVAGVAHEINNPLAYVSNNVAILQRDVGHVRDILRLYQEAEGTLEIHQRELLARIRDLAAQVDMAYVLDNLDGIMARSREGLKRIEQIIRDLRDFVRFDDGERKKADINAGIESTVQIIRSLARSRGVDLEVRPSPLPEVTCYPAKLNQVILNLIANAIDACPPDGCVTVGTRPADGGVEISIADNGHGIDPAIQARIFDPFFTTKPVGKGTGLGLSISLGIVRAHGGTIHCDSAPGRGTLFVVRVPLEPPPQNTAGPPG